MRWIAPLAFVAISSPTSAQTTPTNAWGTPAHTCQPDTDLGTVTRMLWERDSGFIPVLGAAMP